MRPPRSREPRKQTWLVMPLALLAFALAGCGNGDDDGGGDGGGGGPYVEARPAPAIGPYHASGPEGGPYAMTTDGIAVQR